MSQAAILTAMREWWNALLVLAVVSSGCSIQRTGLGGVDAAAGTDSGPVPNLDARPAADTAMADGPTDTGRDVGVEDFRDVAWGDAVPLPGTADGSRCETDPVLTSDLQWLFLSRQESAEEGCFRDRRFHVFRWNAGSPTYVGMLPRFDASRVETNPHPLDGRYAGEPGRIVFFHSANDGSGPDDVRWTLLEGSAPMTPVGGFMLVTGIDTPGDDEMPTLTVDGTRMVFTRDRDLWEASGAAPDDWRRTREIGAVNTADPEIDPAVSPDGRVLVFGRIRPGVDQGDLYVARRDDPEEPFGPAEPLATVNTDDEEADAFITSTGDLLFASDRDGPFRVYVAPRIAP